MNSTGQWGVSSGIIKTAGATDNTCRGLVSSSKTSSEINQDTDTSNHRHTRLIVGLTVGLSTAFVILLAAGLYMRHRRKVLHEVHDDQDVAARPCPYGLRSNAGALGAVLSSLSLPSSKK